MPFLAQNITTMITKGLEVQTTPAVTETEKQIFLKVFRSKHEWMYMNCFIAGMTTEVEQTSMPATTGTKH